MSDIRALVDGYQRDIQVLQAMVQSWRNVAILVAFVTSFSEPRITAATIERAADYDLLVEQLAKGAVKITLTKKEGVVT